MGLTLASALASAGWPVAICGGRRPIDRIDVTEDGLTRTWPVSYLTDAAEAAAYPTVVLAVKTYHTRAASPWLEALTQQDSTVLIAQNGIEQLERTRAIVRGPHLLSSVIYINVERTAPGSVTIRRPGAVDLALGADERSIALGRALTAGGLRVGIHTDLKTTAWAKLLTNITANPLTALTGRRVDVIREPGIERLARQLMVEAAEVGRADGAHLTDQHVNDVIHWLRNVPPGATTSMREDRLNGRALEHDALTGAVVRAARRHKIEVPFNEAILSLLAAVDPSASA